MIMSLKQGKIKIEPRIKLNHNISAVFDNFKPYSWKHSYIRTLYKRAARVHPGNFVV